MPFLLLICQTILIHTFIYETFSNQYFKLQNKYITSRFN